MPLTFDSIADSEGKGKDGKIPTIATNYLMLYRSICIVLQGDGLPQPPFSEVKQLCDASISEGLGCIDYYTALMKYLGYPNLQDLLNVVILKSPGLIAQHISQHSFGTLGMR